MEKICVLMKTYGGEALHFATEFLKAGARSAGKFVKKSTVRTGKKLLQKAAPICKTVMLVTAGVSVVSGVIWFFGRKK